MRCVGIYPVGTLVLLESGRLGVVVEPHETSLLTPKVNVFFNTKTMTYIPPRTVDLSPEDLARHEHERAHQQAVIAAFSASGPL